jgi:hypothetical protein
MQIEVGKPGWPRIGCNRQPLSNVTDSSDLRKQKLNLPKIIAEGGITIDLNPNSQSAPSSIPSSREPLANVNDSRDLRKQKLSLPKTTTVNGIKIDFHPLRQNADP